MATGFTTGPILGDPSAPTYVPSTAFEGQDWAGLSRQVVRYQDNAVARNGVIDPNGYEIAPPEPNISPDEANAKYGIDGQGVVKGLSFDQPLPESVAQSLHDAKREELAREDAAARVGPGMMAKAERFGAGFLAGAVDPLNIAASFVPVVGEARYAGWLADAGSVAGRMAIRAGVGAAQGAAGQVPLSALRYGLSQQEQADYSAQDALLDAAYGTVLGGGLHAVGGALHDAWTGEFAGTPEGRLAAADLDTRQGALRTAISQMAAGNRVEVTPAFDAGLRADLMRSTAIRQLTEEQGGRPAPTFEPPDEAGAGAAEPGPASAPDPTAPPLTVAAADAQGVVQTFDTATEAARVQRRLAKNGDQVTVAPDPEGGYTLTRQMDGQPLRDPDGNPMTFDTTRAAQRFVDTAPNLAGRDLSVAPIGETGARLFAVIEGASERDLAGLNGRPELADLGRGPDNSAGAALRAQEAARQAARPSLADMMRAIGSKPPVELEAISGMADRAAATARTDPAARLAQQTADAEARLTGKNPPDEQGGAAPPAVDREPASGGERRSPAPAPAGPPELVAADEQIRRADGLGRAFQQAAACLIGKGL